MNNQTIQINTKTQKNVDSNFIKYGSALGSISLYAIINLLAVVFGDPAWTGAEKIIYGFVFVVIKELFSSITSLFLSGNPKREFRYIKNIYKTERRNYFLATLGGIFGGVIGYSLLTVGALYIGYAYSSPFFAIEVFFVALASRFLLKRKITNLIKGLLLLAVVCLVLIPTLDLALHSNDSVNADDFILGVILVILAVLSWSIESISFDIILDKSTLPMHTFVNIKQFSSFVFGLVLAIPIISAAYQMPARGFTMIGDFFSSEYLMGISAISAGILLAFGRVFFFQTVKSFGATIANVIYDLTSVLQIILGYIIFAFTQNIKYVGSIHHEYYWILSSVLIITVVLVTILQQRNKAKV